METADVERALTELRNLNSDAAWIEVKRARGGLPSRLWETVSAFSNTGGGVILLGVDEGLGFEPVGVVEPAQVERSVASLVSDRMSPPVRALIGTHWINGAAIVAVEIPSLPRVERPCYYMGEGAYRGSYIRVADGDRRLTEYEVGLLMAGRGQPREDERPVEQARRSDLDDDVVDGYVRRLRTSRPRLFAEREGDEILRMTKVLVPSLDGTGLRPSLAGLLSLGVFPQSFFPQLDITFVAYPRALAGEPGPNGERFRDNAAFDGSIGDMVEDALGRLRSRMSHRSVIRGVGRFEIPEYPDLALREAVVNAVAHRDLSAGALGSQVQVEMYPDRVVVRNAGGLFGAVELARLGEQGITATRNTLLLKVLEDVPTRSGGTVAENRGSGIPAMIRSLRAAGMREPDFVDGISFFEVTFANATLLDTDTVAWLTDLGVGGLTDSQLMALARMRRGEELRNRSYREDLGVDSRRATAELGDLVRRGLVSAEGARGAATYRISGMAGGPLVKSAGLTDDPVYLALDGGPLRRAQIDARTALPAAAVRRRLRRLRNAGLVELIGPANSPTATWRQTSRLEA